MKIRIHQNSIRFRFTRPEAMALSQGEALIDRVSVGLAPGQSLAYGVFPQDGEFHVSLQDHTIQVHVPPSQLLAWYEGEDLALSMTQSWDGGHVQVLLEKDMQRLNSKPGEAIPGIYSHPLFGKVRCDHP